MRFLLPLILALAISLSLSTSRSAEAASATPAHANLCLWPGPGPLPNPPPPCDDSPHLTWRQMCKWGHYSSRSRSRPVSYLRFCRLMDIEGLLDEPFDGGPYIP